MRGKQRPQPSPGCAVLSPRVEFLGDEARLGEQERHGEVGPQRAAGEVREMQGVPSGPATMAIERRAGIDACVDQLTAGCLDRDVVGGEEASAVWSRERSERNAL